MSNLRYFFKTIALCLSLSVTLSGCNLNTKEIAKNIILFDASSMDINNIKPTENYKNAGYYYNQLSNTQKVIYEQLFGCINDYYEELLLTNAASDDIYLAYKSLTFDHPEIYWVYNYVASSLTNGDVINTSISFKYTMDKTEIDKQSKKLTEYSNALLSTIPNNADDYTKAKLIYDYIVKNTTYDITGEYLDSLISATSYGKAICQGYARSFMYFCQKAGIECIVIPGKITSTNEDHMWNCALLDGDWYYIDPTWGDTEFKNIANAPEIRYDYFGVTNTQILTTHSFDITFLQYPDCTATKDNYYVKENKFLITSDKDVIKDYLSSISVDKNVSIMCANKTIYNNIASGLIVTKNIFNYLPDDVSNGEYTIKYSTNEELLTFTFWLIK